MAWDSTMRIVEHKTDKEIAHIIMTKFECGDTKDSIKYSLGGLYVRPIVKYVSRNALKEITRINPNAVEKGEGVIYKTLQVNVMNVTREHIIPVGELFCHFDEMYKKSKLTEKYVLKFMQKLYIAVITKEENKKFSCAHLTRYMPEGWWGSKNKDPLDRYRAAGLDDSIWVKEF